MTDRKNLALIAGIIMLVMTLIPPTTSADGWHPSVEYLHLYEPSQKAVIYWNGVTETLILSSAAQAENLTDLAWVIPIISTTVPSVTTGNMTIFEELVDYFKEIENKYHPWWRETLHAGNANVTIILTKEIDIYDIIILQATNTSDLINWLKENNFQIPQEAEDVIDQYINQENCYLIINKIDLKNSFKNVLSDIENDTIDYGSPEYREYSQVLQDLRQGMATPLQFDFTPPEPYYPLTISSLNIGYGVIEVYVIAEHPVTDQNNVLKVDLCRVIDQDLKQKLNQYISTEKADYVTRLSYHGNLQKLSNDAVFSYFPVSTPELPISFHSTSEFDLVIAEHHIWGISWEQNHMILEVQYRFDNEMTWKLAEGTTLWSIDVSELDFADGDHTIHIRILKSNYGDASYTNTSSFGFTTFGGRVVRYGVVQEHTMRMNAFLLSGLVIFSLIAVAIISKKTTFQ